MLVGMIQRITAQIIQVIWQAGFKVNLDKGKTECLANFTGPGAPQVRKEIFIEQQGKIEIETPHGLTDSPQLQVVGSYTHLGKCMGQDLNMAGEIDRQIGQAQTAFRMLQKPIFHNKRISIHTRFQLLESLVCTRLFYNAAHCKFVLRWHSCALVCQLFNKGDTRYGSSSNWKRILGLPRGLPCWWRRSSGSS